MEEDYEPDLNLGWEFLWKSGFGRGQYLFVINDTHLFSVSY